MEFNPLKYGSHLILIILGFLFYRWCLEASIEQQSIKPLLLLPVLLFWGWLSYFLHEKLFGYEGEEEAIPTKKRLLHMISYIYIFDMGLVMSAVIAGIIVYLPFYFLPVLWAWVSTFF